MAKQKKILAVILTLIPVLALMITIFSFSAQEASTSDRTSGGIVSRVIALLYPHFGEIPEEEQKQIVHIFSFLVRKCAHLSEYLLLGAALAVHVKAISACRSLRHPKLLSWLVGTLYAASDELHQRFVPGRSGEAADVLLDSFGVLLGVLLVGLIHALWKKRRRDE